MKNARAARRYAKALMDVVDERHVVASVAGDLELVEQTLRESRELRRLLDSPVVTPARKKAIFRELFASKIGTETLAFLDLLFTKNREALLPAIVQEYAALSDQRDGIMNADVTTAVELAQPQQERLRAELERYTGKKIRIRAAIDRSLKGGWRVQIGDTVLDASVRRQMELLRQRFLEGGAELN
jgi:F-type H+-transporting ATPase subunit delta